MKNILIATFLVLISGCARKPDDCSWEFLGVSRKAVKLRSENDGRTYQKFKQGNPISVAQWYDLVCSFDAKIPEDFRKISEQEALRDMETIEVTLQCWLLATRLEHSEGNSKEKDNDFHIEVGGEPRWDTPHVIVEIPPGPDYCDARQRVRNLTEEDSRKTGHPIKRSAHVFGDPVEVLVRGYVFFDKPHAEQVRHNHEAYCQGSGGRGIHVNGASRVQGIWEIHPVFDIALVHGQGN
jgi:hypothetical protein